MVFTKGQNPHHPKKGASIKADPIRSLGEIGRIKVHLLETKQYRNYCLFVLGINTAWRANELLSITLGQARRLYVGSRIELKQSKNKEYRSTPVNKAAMDAIRIWLSHYGDGLPDHAPLFPSLRGGPLGVPALCNLVKKWCVEVGASGRFSSHTLRKTWGYHRRVSFGKPVVLISQAYGHSSEAQTLRYIGILPEEITALYDDEL